MVRRLVDSPENRLTAGFVICCGIKCIHGPVPLLNAVELGVETVEWFIEVHDVRALPEELREER